MTKAAVAPPSIRRLDGIVEGLEPEVSRARLLQLRMTVRQLERALADGTMPPGSKGQLGVLLSPKGVDAFLEGAAHGLFRDDPSRGELSWSSVATLRDCLKILGEEAGLDLTLPRVWRAKGDALAPIVSAGQRVALWRELAELAAEGPLARAGSSITVQDRARLLAMVGLVLDTGARASELSTMDVADLGEELATVRVRRRPQNAAHLPSVVEECVLREGTRVAVRRWLETRENIVEVSRRRREPALWVSLGPTTDQPVPGFRLQEQGLRLAYRRGVRLLNAVMVGVSGWDGPLPVHVEQLRRGVVPVLVGGGGHRQELA